MRKTLKSLLALGLLLCAPLASMAQEQKPVAVLSVTSYDELVADLNFFGELTEQPDFGTNLEGMLKIFTQGQGLNGLDKKSSWGVAVTTDGNTFTPVGFLPVTDLDKLLTALSGIIGEPNEPDDNGVIEVVTPQGATVYLKPQGKWAFISQAAESLAEVPSNPAALLDDLPKNYDLGVRAYLQNIPTMYRDLALNQIRAGVEASLDRQPDEEDEAYEQRRKFVESQVESIERAFNEVDTLTVGWKIDRNERSTHIDISMTALADTRTARQLAASKDAKTAFGGFALPEAAITATLTSPIAEEDQADALAQIEILRQRAESEIDNDDNLDSEEAKDAVKDVLNDFIDVLVDTVKAGNVDAGAAIVLEPRATRIIAGAEVADGKQFEAALKKLIDLAENEPNFPGVKMDAETHKGVRFHRMTVPVPEEDAHRVLGEEVDLHIGVGAKSVYLAVGSGSIAAVKKAIDTSATAKSTTPLKLSIALGAVLKFAAAMEENPVVSMMAEELENADGKDHILVQALPINNGMTYRLQAEAGVLRVLGQASKMSGAGAGGF